MSVCQPRRRQRSGPTLSKEMSNVNLRISLLPALGLALAATASAGLSNGTKDLAINSFNNQFYHVDGNSNGYYYVDTNKTVPGHLRFWQSAEEIEMVEDAYERSGETVYQGMITQLCNGFNNVVSGTSNWTSWNGFNDDIEWACIAFVRAYHDTGNSSFLSTAEIQFNNAWNRGWDSSLGGGLWQTTGKTSKNACVNGPAAIAGMFLAWYTTGTGFRSQAQQAFNWELGHLYNSSTGQVADHENSNGTLDWGAFTYNQGSFIGAAALQYEDTGNTAYLGYGSNAANWTKNNLAGQHTAGILNDEYDSNGGNGDGPGFKGIFVRWCARYASDQGDGSIQTWLTNNAVSAWNYRNNAGITWGQWWHATPASGNYLTAWECSSAAAAIQTAP